MESEIDWYDNPAYLRLPKKQRVFAELVKEFYADRTLETELHDILALGSVVARNQIVEPTIEA